MTGEENQPRVRRRQRGRVRLDMNWGAFLLANSQDISIHQEYLLRLMFREEPEADDGGDIVAGVLRRWARERSERGDANGAGA